MKPRLIKTEEVVTHKVGGGVSDHMAKELAVALLTGEYEVVGWEVEQDCYKTQETVEIKAKGVSLTIKS
ncbi:hypothetical protein ACRV5I_20440 [Bacillus halotolerans]|uniref:hypothetical protein n=1 Tax=Bacillus halotolerans TaxID=260554 RepID=UPI003EB91879